jgi:hypothetical protein
MHFENVSGIGNHLLYMAIVRDILVCLHRCLVKRLITQFVTIGNRQRKKLHKFAGRSLDHMDVLENNEKKVLVENPIFFKGSPPLAPPVPHQGRGAMGCNGLDLLEIARFSVQAIHRYLMIGIPQRRGYICMPKRASEFLNAFYRAEKRYLIH